MIDENEITEMIINSLIENEKKFKEASGVYIKCKSVDEIKKLIQILGIEICEMELVELSELNTNKVLFKN